MDLTAFNFPDPVEMLYVLDKGLVEGEFSLHDWQIELLLMVSKSYEKANPLKFLLVAANGSGKDRFFIAPTLAWLALTKIQHQSVVTSSSALQLETQTENYFRYLASRANEILGPNTFDIKQRKIFCNTTGSPTWLFATDEPGRVEGYHPITPSSEQCIIINEAKSIDDELFKGINRCTGFTRWLEISSPGKTSGHLYDAFRISRDVKECKDNFGGWISRRITSYDCPHKDRKEIDDDKLMYMETSPYFRSKHLAEFTSEDEQVVITFDALKKCMLSHLEEKLTSAPLRAGLDLAAGGDENVLSVWKGNSQIAQECFIERDTSLSVDRILQLFLKHGFSRSDAPQICADDGGVGRAIIDQLYKQGWEIRRVLNQSSALNTRQYGNRGAEIWFAFSNLVNMCLIRLLPDQKLRDQLSSRYYKQQGNTGKIILEAKIEARAHGHPSPDRADAAVLANVGITVDMLSGAKQDPQRPSEMISQEDLVTWMDRKKFSPVQKPEQESRVPFVFGNFSAMIDSYYEDLY